jgi:hypothetical protein
MHANLFTTSFQGRLLTWRRLRQWSLVWLALLVVGGAWGLTQVPSLVAARDRLDEALVACEPTRIVLAEIESLEGELAAEEQRLLTLLPFGPDGRPLAVLGALVEATRDAESRLYIRSITYSNPAPFVPLAPVANAGGPGAVPAKAAEAPQSTLVIEGVSSDDESVDRFVHDLLETGEVTHVELKSCVREAGGGIVRPAAPASGSISPRNNSAPSAADPRSPSERLRFEIHCRV